MYRQNRSVISSINKSATLFKCLKPPSFQKERDKMFPSKSAKLSMEFSARLDMDSSVTQTIAKCVPPKMREYKTRDKNKSSNTQEQDCGTTQENQLKIVNGNLCQIVLINKCSDNSKKECNSVQSLKKITHEKECDIRNDHQFKVENVWQCRQVPEQMCNTVSKRVGSTESVKECQTVRECSAAEKVRECNLVNNHVCNHCDKVPFMQCNDLPKILG